MATFDIAMEMRLRLIEERLTKIDAGLSDLANKADLAEITKQLAVINTRLDNLPTRWMFWLFIFTTAIPIYGILATLLWTTVHH